MLLSRFAFVCLITLTVVSCSKNYKTDDRRAMSIVAIPLYDSSGQFVEPLSFLKAGKVFYVTDDIKETEDGTNLVRVIWDNDSTGFVNEVEFLRGGQYAVVTGTDSQVGIPIFQDPQLTQSYDDPFPERWMLVAAAKPADKSTAILFDPGNGEVLKGFVSNSLVVTDQKEIDFYNMFMNFFWMSKGDSIVQLPEYKDYKLMPIATIAAAEDMNAELGEGDYEDDGAGVFDNNEFERVIAETDWMIEGQPSNEPGGVVKKFFVFEDGTHHELHGGMQLL